MCLGDKSFQTAATVVSIITLPLTPLDTQNGHIALITTPKTRSYQGIFILKDQGWVRDQKAINSRNSYHLAYSFVSSVVDPKLRKPLQRLHEIKRSEKNINESGYIFIYQSEIPSASGLGILDFCVELG